MPNVHETKLNVFLSQILTTTGLNSRSEIIRRGAREDIVIHFQGLRIVLEGSYSRADAEADATRRIDQFPIDLAIAIHYFEPYSQDIADNVLAEKLKAAQYNIKIILPIDISDTILRFLYERRVIPQAIQDWFLVDIQSLSNIIKESAQFIITEPHIREIENEVDDFIRGFKDLLKNHPRANTISLNLYNIFFDLYGFSIGNINEIDDVIFTQAGLALLLSTIYYESIRYKYSLESIDILSRRTGIIAALQRAIEDILAIDYEPIFRVTKEILHNLPPQNSRVYQNLLELSLRIASKHSLLRRDLAGRIYHRVVGEYTLRKGLATYYTQIPSAYLLLYLANPLPVITNINREEKKVEFDLPSICDFACGSGTLLTAAYSVLRTNFFLKLMKEGVDLDPNKINAQFHKKCMASIYGIDVLKYATQITALNLAFHNPEIELSEFNTFSLPLGIRNQQDVSVSLGSLNYIRELDIERYARDQATQTGITTERQILFIPKKYDLIVMNPPFTRATGRGSQEGGSLFGFIMNEDIRHPFLEEFNSVRKIIRRSLINGAMDFLRGKNLEFLITEADYKAFKGIGQAGEGLLFLYLADKWIKKGGKIAFVLPKNFLLATSWFLVRTLILKNYHLESIVISFDGDRGFNFSQSTKLSECLFVAKRIDEHIGDEKTKIIMLLQKPKTSIEAMSLINSINDATNNDTNNRLVEINDCSAFILFINRKLLIENINNWGRFVFLPSFRLLNYYLEFLNGKLNIGEIDRTIPITILNNLIYTIGIDRRQFTDDFEIINNERPGSVKVLHGGEEEIRTTMFIQPNAFALPSEKGIRIFEEKASKLLIPERIRFNTAHVISLYTDISILGNIFYAIKLNDNSEKKLKVLCVWFNTTFGILSILADRQETEGAWINIKMTQWRLIPVLNIEQISNEILEILVSIFENYKNVDFKRIPIQFDSESDSYQLRLEFDKAFIKAFGININDDILHSFYKEIHQAFNQWI